MAGIVLDASFVIALFDGSDAHNQWAVDLLIHTTDQELHISALTLAEALVYPTKNGTEDALLQGLRSIGISVLPVLEDDATGISGVRAASGLRMPDAIVLHCARHLSASIATADTRLTSIAAKQGVSVYSP